MTRLFLALVLFLPPIIWASRLSSPASNYPFLLALLFPATMGWLLAVRWSRTFSGNDRNALGIVLAVGALARLAWLAPEPLSDDLYRYLWDGRVAQAGIHPAAHAPDAPELAHLRDEAIWPKINHPDVPTIYPPVAQVAFRWLDRTFPSERGVRTGAAALDLAGAVLLAMLLSARGRPPLGSVVVAWCPLSVMESAGGGHVDVLGSALLVGALAVAASPSSGTGTAVRAGTQGLLVVLAAMVKPVPVLIAPALLLRTASRRRPAWVAGAVLAAGLALPYLAAGPKVLAGFLEYAQRWRFNDSFYSLLVTAGLSPLVSRALLVGCAAAIVFGLTMRVKDPLRAGAGAVAVGLMLSPTVHPWYALWLVPLLPFLPQRLVPAGFGLVAVLPVSYAASWMEAVTGTWSEPGWMRLAVWIPVLALTALGFWRSPGERSSTGS